MVVGLRAVHTLRPASVEASRQESRVSPTPYPTFFGTLWEGTAELCRSRAYVEAARGLRAAAEESAAALGPPPIAGRLGEIGYGARELDDIRAMIEIFSHGNPLYFLLALIARLLLEGGDWGGERGGAGAARAFEGRHAPDLDRPFLLIKAHHADAPTRALYEDVKATLGLPFVNTDYRALARWPSYFALAWKDLKAAAAGGAEHRAIECLFQCW